MTNKDILSVIQGLSDLEELDLPLNIKTSYTLARNRQILTPFTDIINQKRIELYKKFGDKTDNATYKVPNEKIPDLEVELNELLDIIHEEYDPYLTKSGLNHRFRKLKELEMEFKEKNKNA